MLPLRRILVAAMLALAAACGSHGEESDPAEDAATSLAALRVSRGAPYGVPATGDVGLDLRVSLAATAWSRLTDEQLVGWAELWRELLEESDRPHVGYSPPASEGQGPGPRLNLFDKSPKDGFCVAYARNMESPVDGRVRAFLEAVR